VLSNLALSAVLAATTKKTSHGSSAGTLIFVAVLLVAGYLLLVRPARTRQRRAVQQRQGLEPGVEVTTTAGLLATVVAVDDDVVTLEIAPGVHARFVKGAIARVHQPVEESIAHEDSTGGEPTGGATTDGDPTPNGSTA
jgi:preprotein translocase subunit YajC